MTSSPIPTPARPATPSRRAPGGATAAARGLALAGAAGLLALAAAGPPAGAQVRPPIVFPPDAGVIDVSRAPYAINARDTGDDTAKLRRALSDPGSRPDPRVLGSHFSPRTIYLPEGRYRVTDTIGALNPAWRERGDPDLRFLGGFRLVGAGVGRTVIEVPAGSPNFADPRNPRPVIRTGGDPRRGGQANTGFGNYVQHLSIEIGPNNPGAVGIRYDVANSGALGHVAIRAADASAGAVGLQLLGGVGPGYVHDLRVDGFGWAVHLSAQAPDEGAASQIPNNLVLERLRLYRPRVGGVLNEGKNLELVNIKTFDAPLSIGNKAPQSAMVLVNAALDGTRDGGPAIEIGDRAFLHARQVTTTDHPSGAVVRNATTGALPLPGRTGLVEWGSHGHFPGGSANLGLGRAVTAPVSLNLPIVDTPEYHNPDLARWRKVARPPTPDHDSAADFRAALAACREVVYFPYGTYVLKGDVEVPSCVRKIDFFFSTIDSQRGAKLVVADRTGPVPPPLVIENLNGDLPIAHQSHRPVAVRNVRNGAALISAVRGATGDFFAENIGPGARLTVGPGVRAWLRQIDRGNEHLVNDGGTVWLLGDNVEGMEVGGPARHGTPVMHPIATRNGGCTEVVGGAADALYVPHAASLGAFLQVDSTSRISAVLAGMVEGRGSWESLVSDRGGAFPVALGRSALVVMPPVRGERERIALPLYVSPPKPGARPCR